MERDMKRIRCGTFLVVLVVAFAMNARAQTSNGAAAPTIKEDDRPAPVDYGFGPRVVPNDNMRAAQEARAGALVARADARSTGVFGPPVAWPLIAIHAVLLPDGRVMNYGTDERGQQGAQLVYDVWDPKQGTASAAHMVLPNTTSTDTFCGAQSLMVATGEVLTSGGDKAINGEQHFSDQATTIFNYSANEIRTGPPMLYPRWYPTIVALPNGEMLVLGGRENKLPDIPAPTPEVFTPNVGWRTLWGATSDAAFGGDRSNWYYPRAVHAPNGKVFVLSQDGKMFYLDPAGEGTITELAKTTVGSPYSVPTVMFAPGAVLSVRAKQNVIVYQPERSAS
jgi:hypothetical protein